MGPLIPLFWTSGDVSSGFKARVGCLIQACGGIHVTCSLRFTPGVIPTDLLAASMAAKPSLSDACDALPGLKTRSYRAVAHSVRSGRRSTD